MAEDIDNTTSIDSDGNLINNTAKEKVLTDVEKADLKGPVHKIMEHHYKTFGHDGKVFISYPVTDGYSKVRNTMQEFDEKGKKIVVESYNNFYKYRSVLNEKGVEYESYSYNKGNVLNHKYVTKFNAEGKVAEVIVYDGNLDLVTRTVSVYDEYSNIIQHIEYNKEGKINFTQSWTYENGKKEYIEVKRIDHAGEIVHWNKRKLNNKDHPIESIDLAPDGSITKKVSFAECYDSEGNHLPRVINQYQKEIYEITYEYDQHNNWIKQYSSYRDMPVSIFIRDILYYGEPAPKDIYNREVVFDVSVTIIDEEMTSYEKLIEKEDFSSGFNEEETKWLTDRTLNAENFSYLGYYVLKNNEFPSLVLYNASNIDVLQLVVELKKGLNAKVIQETKSQYGDWSDYISRLTIVFPQHTGYMIHASQINSKDNDEYHVPDFITANYERDDELVYFSPLYLLHPSDKSGNRDIEGIEAEIKKCFDKCTLELIPEKPEIYMIEVERGNFSLKQYPVKDDFEINNLDVSYGRGFATFHQELMNRFRRENKGLVLFHGLPGTGKTFYIRHLLREMALSNKRVIYMPPNMVDHLVEPAFMTFLTQTVKGYSADGYFCVLLIEDAEPLLISRASENRIQGITNLLNMTDGILNDMLKLQIICTFNVELKQLDPALLRPGRLIASKEFKALNELDANLLAQRLGINFRFRKPATLSEIYSKLKDKGTIIHEDY